ncbi:MAG TPA: metallophosphoesterase [Acidimicrobiia bacterium]|nr:metallophosphoesterase [Acidimicrobiia bacterium]
MLLVADVHGANDALAGVAQAGEPLLVLGDLLNFIDYRTYDGMLADVAGKDFVAQLVHLRANGDRDGASRVWREFSSGREQWVRDEYQRRTEEAYAEVRDALDGAEAYIIHGNVDRPDMLRAALPPTARWVDGEVVEIEGLRVGFAGGGMPNLGVPGEVSDEEMRAKLAGLGPVDILCTHVPPAVRQLSNDVIGGRAKESQAILEYVLEMRPAFHYFGDVHQPQATEWRVGGTRCRNVGYFRATGRPIRHG